MLSSIQEHTSEKVNVHILSNDFTDIEKQMIENLFNKKQILTFEFYVVNDDVLLDINIIAEHLTIQTLYRLLIPNLLPRNIKKVIYLDSDLVVEKDISILFNIQLDNYLIGAVNELFEPILPIIQFESIRDYFNAGVLLINLEKWRQVDFVNQCLDYAQENPEKLLLGDQDILNGVLKGEWKRIPLEWNVVRGVFEEKNTYKKYYPFLNIEGILSKPSILHYTSPSKPWHYMDTHEGKSKYFHYLDLINFKYNKYPELEVLKRKKNIIVFGAGSSGRSILKILNGKSINVNYFTDNNSTIWGTSIETIEIIPPNKLREMSNLLIVVTSVYEKEISEQLEGMGYVENLDFCKIHKIHELTGFNAS